MPRKPKEEVDRSLERLLELLDEQVKQRGAAVLAVDDATTRIVELASEARRKGATMPELARRVKRMDTKERRLKPVTRQALDTMLAVYEKRREPRTTRASRRARDTRTSSAAGRINLAAFGAGDS